MKKLAAALEPPTWRFAQLVDKEMPITNFKIIGQFSLILSITQSTLLMAEAETEIKNVPADRPAVHLQEVQVGGSQYRDAQFDSRQYDLGLQSKIDGADSSVLFDLGLSFNDLRLLGENTKIIQKKLIENQGEQSTQLSGDLTYQWQQINQFQLGYSNLRGQVSQNQSIRLGASRWFLHERLELGLMVSRSFIRSEIVSYLDTDFKNITTREKEVQTEWAQRATLIWNRSRVLTQSLRYATDSSRPDAWALALGIRQFVESLDGALHLNATSYLNLGQIEPVTTTGELRALDLGVEWLQKLKQRHIVAGGYQYHEEQENPRAHNDPWQERKSDLWSLAYRYRLNPNWFERSSEIFSHIHWLKNSDGASAPSYGFGIKYLK